MRRILSLLLVFLTVLFCLSDLKVFAYSDGDGTEGNPYVIKTPQDLQDINNDLSAYYVLGNNLDMSDFEWTPIGSDGNAFIGEFDGAGYEIANLELKLYQTNIFGQDAMAGGMFGAIGSGASVYNFGLQYFLDELGSDTNNKVVMIGGLATLVEGDYDIDIRNIWVDGTIDFSTTSTGRYTSVGGLIGEAYYVNDLSYLSFTGDIFVDAEYSDLAVGGIVGWGEDISISDNRIIDAEIETGAADNTESAVGGIVGYLSIYDSYFEDDYILFRNIVMNSSVVGANSVHAGGVVGMIYDDYDGDFSATRNLISNVEVTGGLGVGGFVGNSYYTEYYQNELINVKVHTSDDYDEENSDNGLGGFVGTSSADTIYYLMISGTSVGGQSGYFEGAGGVAGIAVESYFMHIDASVQVASMISPVGGLVGYSDDNYISYAVVSGSVQGFSDIGGLIGYSLIYDTLEYVSFNGEISGIDNVGGLVGYNYNGWLDIYYATVRASIVGEDYLGGILGFSEKTVDLENIYFAGTLESVAEYEAKVDPITNSTENIVLDNVFYDNEVYTEGSIFSGRGYATVQFKDVDSEVAEMLRVDRDFEYDNEFFVSPVHNDGYFTLYQDRDYVIFFSSGDVVAIQLSYGRIMLRDEDEGDYVNPYVKEYVRWGTPIQAWEITRDGYLFDGWSQDETGEDMIDPETFEYDYSNLYAQWKEELPETGEAGNLGFIWMSLGVLGLLISRKRKA